MWEKTGYHKRPGMLSSDFFFEQAAEHTVELLDILDAMALLRRHGKAAAVKLIIQ